jgi:hypothetical protein
MAKGKINREELVQTLVKWRLEKKLSTHTLLKVCMEQFGYKQSYAYELVKEAREHIAQVYKDCAVNAYEESVAELEEQLESAKRSNDKKLLLDIQKELNKIKQLYVEKVVHSGAVQIETIKLKEIIKPKPDAE